MTHGNHGSHACHVRNFMLSSSDLEVSSALPEVTLSQMQSENGNGLWPWKLLAEWR